ncbi:MAG: SpoIIE family protein phosphatase [Magnetospirillum sp.]|nr:SpoIIE family protein phosphatase [Magnetospirillum sp.]
MSVAAEGPSRVLIVDDEPVNRHLLLAALRVSGYDCIAAVDGQDAWDILDRNPATCDVVLLDRMMPRMDGMTLLTRLKADERLRSIPVIMQTACDSEEDIAGGIAAGVFYYLLKPLDRRVLISVMQSAIETRTRLRRLQGDLVKRTTALTLMEAGTFRFATLDEGRDLAVSLARACPRPGSLVVGLNELFTNAVEHGNLGITFEHKAVLLAEKRWAQEVENCLALPENAAKRVTVRFERRGGEVRFTITDEGSGFDWQHFLDLDMRRAFHPHGRGIVMARRMSFESVAFRDPGNEVVCVVRDGGEVVGNTASTAAGATAAAVAGDDLKAARAMQGELLPTPEDIARVEYRYGVRISGLFETSCEVGGDIWGLTPLDGRRFAVFLADFSGHGYSAALNTFRLHTLVHNLTEGRDNPAAYMEQLNRHLFGLLPLGQYATMLYGVVDVGIGEFVYAAAAAPHPLAISFGTAGVMAGQGHGLPLGVVAAARYPQRQLPLPPGTLLFLHSDALNECSLRARRPLGSQGVAEMLGERVGQGTAWDAASLIRPFLDAVQRPLRDDLTAVSCLLPG